MNRRRIAALSLLVIVFMFFSTLQPSSQPATSFSDQPLNSKPQANLDPPTNQTGSGYAMSLTDSVNDNRTVSLTANNTRAAATYRNATLSAELLTGFTKVWQNLTLTQLQATYDARVVQGGSSSTEYLRARNQTGSSQGLAMRFTTLDKVNLTGIWIYYSLGGLSSIPFTINVTASDTKKPSGSSGIGGGSIPATGGVDGWYYVQLSSPVTLVRGNYYWLIANASALNTAFFDWYYIRDQGGEDGIYGSAYRTAVGWLDETQMISLSLVPAYFNLMLVLKVIPVDDSYNVRQYSSPEQVRMSLNSTTGNWITTNSSRISNTYSTFVICTNTSVTFTARWDARFEKTQAGVAATNFRAENGLTFWNVTFVSGVMPTNLYTLYNRTLRVYTIPMYSYWVIQPDNVSNTGTVVSFTPYYTSGSGYVFIVQAGNPDSDPWVDTWLIKAKSTYKLSATLASQVVAGLPLTLSVSTNPYSPSWCNVTFYNSTGKSVYSNNVTVPSTSFQLTLKLNDTGDNKLLLFDRWTGGNEASFNSTLTVYVWPHDCNVTVNDRNRPVLGSTAMFKFKFYNNSLGMDDTWIQPTTVSINGTVTTNFAYNAGTGNTTVYMSTASGGWRTGNNTVIVSAKSGVFNATKQTWILVQERLCNVTVISFSQPYPYSVGSLRFRFFNSTIGASPVLINPTSVKINGTTPISVTYSGGVVTVNWSLLVGGWHSGLNYVNVSATRGTFSNFTVWPITLVPPSCTVSIISTSQPWPGNNASVSFWFLNNTAGGAFINPASVSINGTVTAFTYSGGVVTANWSVLTGGWHLGLNNVNVSATSGTFTSFTVTPITLVSPACSVTIVSVSQPLPGDEMSIQLRFFDNTGGGVPMMPSLIRINGTVTAFTYSGGVVTANWSVLTGGWHLGLNNVNVSATSGIFTNFTVELFNLVSPACAISGASSNTPILGDNVYMSFQFLNNTGSGVPMSPDSVWVNGTSVTISGYSGGVVTVQWSTATGGWRAGLNNANVSAGNGVFRNFTIVGISMIQPLAVLILNATSYSGVYGDIVHIGFKFLNTTSGSGSPPSLPLSSLLYLNGSQVDFTLDGEWYVYSLNTASRFSTAGSFHLNFTARYAAFYIGTNVTSITLDRVSMTLTLTVAQSSVAVGSSLSASATLTYTANGTHAPQGLVIQFDFVVTYADRHNATITMSGETDDNGTAIATLLATSNMTSITVQVTYVGSLILYGDTDLKGGIPVTPPTPFPILIVVGATGVGAFVVIAALLARSHRRVGKAKEAKKVSRLTEAASLAQLVVVHLGSGRCVFSRNLGSEESVDPHLISGFLTANQAVLGEAFKRKAGATLKSADYGDYKVISHVGRYVMSTLFSTDVPGKELQETLQGFTKKFEDKYADALVNWDGTMDLFKDAEEIAAEAFALSLCCPYMIDEAAASKAKLGGVETRVLREATKLSVDRGVFFMPRIIDFLLTKEKVKRSKAVDILDALGKKGVLKMLTVDEAAQIVREKERAADSGS